MADEESLPDVLEEFFHWPPGVYLHRVSAKPPLIRLSLCNSPIDCVIGFIPCELHETADEVVDELIAMLEPYKVEGMSEELFLYRMVPEVFSTFSRLWTRTLTERATSLSERVGRTGREAATDTRLAALLKRSFPTIG